ncbi:hypothetical protein [Cytobacillus massiliigabonensis]|uniref:hypothetical protein n=1 Tax=Cytobacillus massiliigabonensis TaxID=1871011 RepID=UPI00115AC710|nr:hypothetical protein [Cytobacillus massiliigabonensis]
MYGMLCTEIQIVMSRNPVIQRAFERGKLEGYQLGLEHGESRGRQKTVGFVADKFKKLSETPGIGPKTAEKIKEIFGKEYFNN